MRPAPLQPILLVENSLEVRRAMTEWVRLMGYAVLSAIDGTDAIAKLHSGSRPCLILLDLQSPQSLEFRKAQMRDQRTADIPVVVYSGLYDPRMAAERLGATAYFYAPFDMDALRKVIEAHCRKYPRRRTKHDQTPKNGTQRPAQRRACCETRAGSGADRASRCWTPAREVWSGLQGRPS